MQRPERDPSTEQQPTTDQSPEPAPVPPPQAAPPPGMPAGWYPAEAGRLRYYDGTVWTGAISAAADAQPKASYGERYLRRLPIVSLVITGLYLLLTLSTFAGDPLKFVGRGWAGSSNYRSGVVVGAVIGIVLAGFFWTLFVALFPGKHKDRRTGTSMLLIGGALVLAAGVGTVFALQVVRTPAAEVPAVATAAEGCQTFLDTVEVLTSTRANDAKASATFAALQDSVRSTNPEMAADLQPLLATTVTSEQASAATQSIVLRCLDQGHLTEDDVQTWAQKIQSYAS